jgi:hypothetical protein
VGGLFAIARRASGMGRLPAALGLEGRSDGVEESMGLKERAGFSADEDGHEV